MPSNDEPTNGSTEPKRRSFDDEGHSYTCQRFDCVLWDDAFKPNPKASPHCDCWCHQPAARRPKPDEVSR